MLTINAFRNGLQVKLTRAPIAGIQPILPQIIRTYDALTRFYEGEGTLIELRNELRRLTPEQRRDAIQAVSLVDWNGSQTLEAEFISARLKVAP